jgi:hypothetical protein
MEDGLGSDQSWSNRSVLEITACGGFRLVWACPPVADPDRIGPNRTGEPLRVVGLLQPRNNFWRDSLHTLCHRGDLGAFFSGQKYF